MHHAFFSKLRLKPKIIRTTECNRDPLGQNVPGILHIQGSQPGLCVTPLPLIHGGFLCMTSMTAQTTSKYTSLKSQSDKHIGMG